MLVINGEELMVAVLRTGAIDMFAVGGVLNRQAAALL